MDRVQRAACECRRSVDEMLATLVTDGLNSNATVREILEALSREYRARLEREGKLDQSAEEILQDLRETREEIARELYP